jgi:hypothetical protein
MVLLTERAMLLAMVVAMLSPRALVFWKRESKNPPPEGAGAAPVITGGAAPGAAAWECAAFNFS